MTKATQLPLLETAINVQDIERNKPKAAKYSILHSDPSKETTLRKYADIKKRFQELKAIRFDGMSLKHADIVAKIAYEFYMDEFSIGLVLLRKD
jgi:hypothetical protein